MQPKKKPCSPPAVSPGVPCSANRRHAPLLKQERRPPGSSPGHRTLSTDKPIQHAHATHDQQSCGACVCVGEGLLGLIHGVVGRGCVASVGGAMCFWFGWFTGVCGWLGFWWGCLWVSVAGFPLVDCLLC